MPRIGANFVNELQAEEQTTGLKLLVPGVSWGDPAFAGGLDPLPEHLTQDQVSAINRVLTAHDPTKPSAKSIADRLQKQVVLDLLAQCAAIEADLNLPEKIRILANLLKRVRWTEWMHK